MLELKELPEKLYQLLDPETDHEVNEENLEFFASSLKDLIRSKLRKQERGGALRFSSLGKKDRQVWYSAHPDGSEEKLTGQTLLKFLYGDLTEALIMLLIKEAGYEVTNEQAQVEVDGVYGHTDASVDGIVVDVKSASSYGFQKFKHNRVTEDDPFGYVDQLSGYANVLTPDKEAAWIAFDKVSGEVCVSFLSPSIIKHYKPEDRIKHLKGVIQSETPPERCYEPVADGASGNLKLGTQCSYCSWKRRCYPDLRTFAYSGGPRFLVKVAKEPNVPEIMIND